MRYALWASQTVPTPLMRYIGIDDGPGMGPSVSLMLDMLGLSRLSRYTSLEGVRNVSTDWDQLLMAGSLYSARPCKSGTPFVDVQVEHQLSLVIVIVRQTQKQSYR